MNELGKGASLRERAFEFACSVLDLHRYFYRRDATLRDASSQATRSAGSIGANLEEADAAESKLDFIHKCNISLKEARETRYWLRILDRAATTEQNRIASLIRESTELIAILTTIIRKSREHK
jgi:four helix bundle protein